MRVQNGRDDQIEMLRRVLEIAPRIVDHHAHARIAIRMLRVVQQTQVLNHRVYLDGHHVVGAVAQRRGHVVPHPRAQDEHVVRFRDEAIRQIVPVIRKRQRRLIFNPIILRMAVHIFGRQVQNFLVPASVRVQHKSHGLFAIAERGQPQLLVRRPVGLGLQRLELRDRLWNARPLVDAVVARRLTEQQQAADQGKHHHNSRSHRLQLPEEQNQRCAQQCEPDHRRRRQEADSREHPDSQNAGGHVGRVRRDPIFRPFQAARDHLPYRHHGQNHQTGQRRDHGERD